MAKRFTDTDLWDKEWFMALKPKLKCLVKFVRDKCDLSGVWSPNWKAASMYIDEPVCENELLEIDGGSQFIKLETGKIFCVDFLSFQYGKLTEKSPVHRKILSLLASHGIKSDLSNIPYKYPINTPQEKEEDKEEEKDKEKEEDKEEEKEKGADQILTAEIWPTFENFWEEYDKKIDRPKCELKWNKLTQDEREAIMEYIPAYKISVQNKEYRKHPATFLNNRSWENEIIISNEPGKQLTNHRQQSVAVAEKLGSMAIDVIRKAASGENNGSFAVNNSGP